MVSEFVNSPGNHFPVQYPLSPNLSFALSRPLLNPAMVPTIKTTPSALTISRTTAAVRRKMGSV
jgi:hypothetical protein